MCLPLEIRPVQQHAFGMRPANEWAYQHVSVWAYPRASGACFAVGKETMQQQGLESVMNDFDDACSVSLPERFNSPQMTRMQRIHTDFHRKRFLLSGKIRENPSDLCHPRAVPIVMKRKLPSHGAEVHDNL